MLDGEIFYSLAEAEIVIESWRRHHAALLNEVPLVVAERVRNRRLLSAVNDAAQSALRTGRERIFGER